MQIKHLALAAGLLLTSAGVASAAPALVTGDLNLRTGPGTNYRVTTVLPGGSTVNVGDCGGGWCRVAWRGGDGFASSSYLDLGGRFYGAAPPPVYVAPPPVVTFGFGWGGPRFYGGSYRHDRYYGRSYRHGRRDGHRRYRH
jgi:uncharacterized protein YraI